MNKDAADVTMCSWFDLCPPYGGVFGKNCEFFVGQIAEEETFFHTHALVVEAIAAEQEWLRGVGTGFGIDDEHTVR
jgi:hypothetical protein